MDWITAAIDSAFGLAVLVNALLFLFQLVRIVRRQRARDLSVTTFLGFAVIQTVTVFYGFLNNDLILAYGVLPSLVLTLAISVMIIVLNYRNRGSWAPFIDELLALLPGHVYWVDRSGVFLGCNNQQLSDLNLSSIDEYRGKTYEDFLEPDIARTLRETDQEIMRNDRPLALEELDMPSRVYWTQKTPLHDQKGRVIGLLGVSVDISDRKKAEKELKLAKEKAEAANMAKTEFVYNMRHDLRTPLSNTIGLSRILQSQESSEAKRAIIGDILSSTEALMRLLNEMLDFSNIQQGFFSLKQEPMGLRVIIDELVAFNSASISNKGLNFEVDYDDAIPATLIGDKMRVHRILMNLLSNAIKFTSEGSISLSVSITGQDNGTISLQFVLKDTGIGIPEDKLEMIFGRFNRAANIHDVDYQGSGLGLAIVRQFVEELGGSITVESELGKGAVFTCSLPFLLDTGERSGSEDEYKNLEDSSR